VARFRSWEPTVAPIWASSPAAWTAVVTIGVPSPARRGGGGGGVDGRCAAVAFCCAAAPGDCFTAFFTAVGFDDVVAVGFDDVVAVAFGDFVAVARDRVAAPRRSPPRRVGRVARRLPRTLSSAPDFALFFDFFLADFCVMDTVIERRRAPARFDFRKYSA
jgi:hypothetical protein